MQTKVAEKKVKSKVMIIKPAFRNNFQTGSKRKLKMQTILVLHSAVSAESCVSEPWTHESKVGKQGSDMQDVQLIW